MSRQAARAQEGRARQRGSPFTSVTELEVCWVTARGVPVEGWEGEVPLIDGWRERMRKSKLLFGDGDDGRSRVPAW